MEGWRGLPLHVRERPFARRSAGSPWVSDDRLRELERRWKETGAVEDEAAYLKERVRAGELSPRCPSDLPRWVDPALAIRRYTT
jgi:hypothetical protein